MENKICRIIGSIILAAILGVALIILLKLFISDIKSQKEKALQNTQKTCRARFPSQRTTYVYHSAPTSMQIPDKSQNTIYTPPFSPEVEQCETETLAIETLSIWSKSPPLAVIIWVIVTFFTKLISKVADDCYSMFGNISCFVYEWIKKVFFR